MSYPSSPKWVLKLLANLDVPDVASNKGNRSKIVLSTSLRVFKSKRELQENREHFSRTAIFERSIEIRSVERSKHPKRPKVFKLPSSSFSVEFQLRVLEAFDLLLAYSLSTIIPIGLHHLKWKHFDKIIFVKHIQDTFSNWLARLRLDMHLARLLGQHHSAWHLSLSAILAC